MGPRVNQGVNLPALGTATPIALSRPRAAAPRSIIVVVHFIIASEVGAL